MGRGNERLFGGETSKSYLHKIDIASSVPWLAAAILLVTTLFYRSEAHMLREQMTHERLRHRRRRLAEEQCVTPGEATPSVHPLLERALGVNGTILQQVQHDLVQRIGLPGFRWDRVHTSPLRPKYKSLAADVFVRLHALLFEQKLLPLRTWGGREFDQETRPEWLRKSMSIGRNNENLLRLAVSFFLQKHIPRVPSGSVCLGIDDTSLLKCIPACHTRWSLKYQPDEPWNPRKARLDPHPSRLFVALDLMSMHNATMAGDASSMFDLLVVQETFEHIRYPYQAAQGLYHLLKPGGLAFWTAPFSTRYHLIPGDYFRYTFDGARQIFLAAGFEVVALYKIGDSAIASGNDLAFGAGDFTAEHLRQSLLQTIVAADGKSHSVEQKDEAMYIGSAIVVRRPLEDLTPRAEHKKIGKSLLMPGRVPGPLG